MAVPNPCYLFRYESKRTYLLISLLTAGVLGVGCETTTEVETQVETPPVGSATVASGTGDDIPASCGGKVPDGFSAEPRFALVLDDGGCLVVARELLLVQPYSREGFEALSL